MIQQWTFRQKIAFGFAATVALTIIVGAIAIWTLLSVVASKDRVILVNGQIMTDSLKLDSAIERKTSAGRGYMLTADPQFLTDLQNAHDDFSSTLARLKSEAPRAGEASQLDTIARLEQEHNDATAAVLSQRKKGVPLAEVVTAFNSNVYPIRLQLATAVTNFMDLEQGLTDEARKAGTDAATLARNTIIVISFLAVLLAALIAFGLTRTLGRQIGTAVSEVRSSSAELQASANQQAMGVKEQATAMSEITTTINELLATSRQIAESAQRVASIAEQTTDSSRSGLGTVDKARESIVGIRQQVDLIVSHMLELGRKSQQIGAVLDIVAEVAEQTNILAINATIEAAGAGEAGKRFGVVADEIRKLADRVAGSTNEIRGLIDDVRGAVNTTVMATETGSKAVDAGSEQFGAVAMSFKQIAELIATTTEAAREIELSTKQQSTAVEQVNIAVENVAQATKETEASLGQTLQTGTQLATLSADLLRLVQSSSEDVPRLTHS